MRALFASIPETSRGRLCPEAESATRTCYQRDRDRIIHAGAFRKLQYKTQVFVYHVGDYFRTRLTHTLEVAQIARSIARNLGLDEDLAEAVALAHDLGHTPFGHAGEDALDRCMEAYGGFRHNDQTLRILTRLEQRYAAFDGLNLTWETLEGVVKHNGPLIGPNAGKAPPPLPATVAAFRSEWDLRLDSFPSAEAQVAALADDIAYNTHDIDDGLRAGLFTVGDLAELPLVGDIVRDVTGRWPGLHRRRLVHEITRRLMDRMVNDLIAETSRRADELGVRSADEVRAAGSAIAAFSDAMAADEKPLREFLFGRMYRHYTVNRETSKARRLVTDLFGLFMAEPNCLPDEWRDAAIAADEPARARIVADYIAGMTDRYAQIEHHRLFALSDGSY
jgi:dGTPase